MEKTWLKHYPAGVPAEIGAGLHPSLVALFDDSVRRHRDRRACLFMGRAFSYGRIDDDARAFAAWLQAVGLVPGDRVALMMSGVPQALVAAVGVLRAGMVVVNIDPQHTPRELGHQLRDSGARAIVVQEEAAATLQQVIDQVPAKTVVVASPGDMLGPLRGALVDHVARHVARRVLPWRLPGALRFNQALARGRRQAFTPPRVGPDDIALLQYTGGTTDASKAAVLLHRNLVASLLQFEAWVQPALKALPPGEQVLAACALPPHHLFGFTAGLLLALRLGGCSLLLPDAHDAGTVLRTLSRHRVHSLAAVDTLFAALARHPAVDAVDWSPLKVSVAVGMAVQPSTARRWLEKTGCPICEGYGLSESSHAVTCNPVDGTGVGGSIGLPLPGTEIRLLDDAGHELPPGLPGEIAVRGPQVMAGYWQRPDETARVMTADGFLRTGDIGVADDRGRFRLVDRKKDLILVSGFNVYPNEVEDVITQMPGVLECAAVGVPDTRAGEAVKVVVVKKDPAITEADIRAFCESNLTGYKRPTVIEFRRDLPKTPVGKVLRRALRG